MAVRPGKRVKERGRWLKDRHTGKYITTRSFLEVPRSSRESRHGLAELTEDGKSSSIVNDLFVVYWAYGTIAYVRKYINVSQEK